MNQAASLDFMKSIDTMSNDGGTLMVVKLTKPPVVRRLDYINDYLEGVKQIAVEFHEVTN